MLKTVPDENGKEKPAVVDRYRILVPFLQMELSFHPV
jgi:hypothetical protein